MPTERYCPTTASTIDILIDLNRNKRPNILVSGLAITAESAQVGYLLDQILPGRGDHVTYYANSLEEALSGAIRLIRHTSKIDADGDPHSWILVVDPSRRLRRYFDPLDEAGHAGLVRHLHFVTSPSDGLQALDRRKWSALITLDADENTGELLTAAHRRGVLRVVAESRPLPAAAEWPGRIVEGDVYVLGENMTDFQVPFGCYSMSPASYRVWDNPLDAMAQTSTFAANASSLTLVIATLRSNGYLTAGHEDVLAQIDASRRVRNDNFRRFSNPSAADLMEAFGLDFDFAGAEGAEITLRDGTTLLDCALGNGANLRGHNPPDLAGELTAHDDGVDYTSLLAGLLFELSGFEVTIPAVSGATSVENALYLARMALPHRPRIVTFRGNFSGKTAATLNVSRYGPQRSASIDGAFEPYYPDVVFIDPFGAGAAEELSAALTDPEVGLVWCELIQGMSCQGIPTELLNIIAEGKHGGGFLVGIDEVLTGIWRSSDTFLLQQSWLPHLADIVSIAKPLSDMMIPMAATLTTPEVLDACRRTNAEAVSELQGRYRNNLGSHVAWHALRRVNNAEAQHRRRTEQTALKEGLDRIAARSPLYESVQGHGTHLRLIANSRYFPFKENGVMGELLGQAFEDLILRRCRVILGRGRFFPPLFPPSGTLAQAVYRLETGLDGVTAATVYATLVRNVAGLAAFAAKRQFQRLLLIATRDRTR